MKFSTIGGSFETVTPEQERLRLADPRNPQPGQVWERDGHKNEVRSISTWRHPLTGKKSLFERDMVIVGGRYFGIGEWRSWACPWWRRRKHWAKCVRWE